MMKKFQHPLITLDGYRFRGQLTAPDIANVAKKFTFPRRMLIVPKGVTLPLGSVFRTLEGEMFLLGDNGTNSLPFLGYRTYKCFKVDAVMTWQRPVTTIDPLTGLAMSASKQSLGSIYGTLEPLEESEDYLKVAEQKWRLLCGVDLALNDLIDGKYTVRDVQKIAGVTLGTVW